MNNIQFRNNSNENNASPLKKEIMKQEKVQQIEQQRWMRTHHYEIGQRGSEGHARQISSNNETFIKPIANLAQQANHSVGRKSAP
jgi:hypothetical protein